MGQTGLTTQPLIQPGYPSRSATANTPIVTARQLITGQPMAEQSIAAQRTVGQSLALAGIAHDARNLVTALKLCAELVAEPGVLAPTHTHFAEEIGSIAEASNHLVKRIAAIARTATLMEERGPMEAPVLDVGASVHELTSLLAALAGPTVQLQIACLPCAGALQLSEENLTRILLNLVRNAADAMPASGGRIRITTQRGGGRSFFWTLPGKADDTCADEAAWGETGWGDAAWGEMGANSAPQTVVLSVEDDGPGIPADLLDRVFEPGFSTRHEGRGWPESPHHGLGLSIVRQLVEEAGGTVRAVDPPGRGARIEIELPLTNVTSCLLSEPASSEQNGLR